MFSPNPFFFLLYCTLTLLVIELTVCPDHLLSPPPSPQQFPTRLFGSYSDIIMHEREKNQLLEEGVELTLKDLQSM